MIASTFWVLSLLNLPTKLSKHLGNEQFCIWGDAETLFGTSRGLGSKITQAGGQTGKHNVDRNVHSDSLLKIYASTKGITSEDLMSR